MEFENAGPSVIKSIRQRQLLNGWLTLSARTQSPPQLEDYRVERLDDERPGLVHYSVATELDAPRFIDRELYHRPPGRIPSGDLIEFG